MTNQILFYCGGFIPLVWGISHLFPTKSVVNGFGDISFDNKLIITMEWIIEGVTLIFIGIIVLGVTQLGPTNTVAVFIYTSSALVLLVLALISLLTGHRINFIPFKL